MRACADHVCACACVCARSFVRDMRCVVTTQKLSCVCVCVMCARACAHQSAERLFFVVVIVGFSFVSMALACVFECGI